MANSFGFRYGSLNPEKREIRLLRMNVSDSMSDPFRGYEMETISLPRPRSKRRVPDYYAISYVRGERPQTTAIEVDGQLMELPVNAFKALLSFRTAVRQLPDRHEKTDSCLVWIDAICIDQSDLTERGDQVSQMGRTFHLAAAVMVWLGDHESPEVCRKALHSVHEAYSVHMHRFDDPFHHFLDIGLGPDKEAKDRICTILCSAAPVYVSTWFERLWTIQESCLAREAWCMFGGGILPLYEITVLAHALEPYASSDSPLHRGVRLAHHRGQLGFSCRQESNILPSVVATMDFAVSDPRDMVYAVLGLFVEARNPIPTEVDYTMSVQEVFARATVQSIMLDGSLAPLQFAACLSEGGRNGDFPSWVMRLDRAKEQTLFHLRPQFRKPDHTWTRVHETPVSSMWKTLRLEGAVCDEVACAWSLNCEPDIEDERFIVAVDWILSAVFRANKGLAHTVNLRHFQSYSDESEVEVLDSASIHSVAQTLAEDLCSVVDQTHFQSIVNSLYRVFKMVQRRRLNPDTTIWSRQVEAWRSKHSTTYPATGCFQRSFFITRRGRHGLGPHRTLSGDRVCVFRGGTSPFVLRRQRSSWCIVGDAYVHGLADPSSIRESSDDCTRRTSLEMESSTNSDDDDDDDEDDDDDGFSALQFEAFDIR